MELQYAENHVTRLEDHLVWTPKYRHLVLKEPQCTTLKQILIKAAYDYDEETIKKYIKNQLREEQKYLRQIKQLKFFP